MSVEIKKLPKSEIEVTGEMPADEFSKFWPKAIAKLSEGVSIPGFRTGKIPEKILIEKVGEGAVLQEAAELALSEIYPKILQDEKIEAVGYPRVNVTKIARGEVLGFKFQTAVLPKIKLPENYQEIAKAALSHKEEIEVEEKEINASLEYLRKAKNRGKEEDLPELDDEFAKTVGDFKTLKELKGVVEKNLHQEKEIKQKEKIRLDSLEAILKKSEVEVPDILIEGEKDKMLHEMKSSISGMGLTWEDYLKHIKKEEKDILDGWADDALRRVKYGLLLHQLAEQLVVEVTPKEVEEEIEKIKLNDDVDRQRIKDYVYGILRNKKLFELLEK